MEKNKKNSTYIGGQALIEGVMMRGKRSSAIAVRHGSGAILLKTELSKRQPTVFEKIPVVRGAINFILMMIVGVRAILDSANAVEDGEDEQLGSFGIFLAVAMGVGLSVLLFILLPSFLASIICEFLLKTDSVLWLSLLEAFIRLAIFIGYLALVSLLPDIKRTFMYHGAEHKTINCFESGLPLTAANVKTCSTRHERCGTSFLFFVIMISIIVFALINWLFSSLGLPDNRWFRMLVRLLLLPLVAGLSYELLKGLAKAKNNWFFAILKAPGMALQRLTTIEPDIEMCEVALQAFKAVLYLESNNSPATDFGQRLFVLCRNEVLQILHGADITEAYELDNILSEALSVPKGELNSQTIITQKQYEKAISYANQRTQGVPFERITGSAQFMGRIFMLNDSTLIPRMESELVCERAISLLKGTEGKTVLDLCTGSGCIGITIAKETSATVTLSDIDENALTMAKHNCGIEPINICKSDLFEGLTDRRFDMIVCNPPYVKTAEITEEVAKYDPVLALDGGEDGLKFYRLIAKNADSHLNDNGSLVLEIGYNQGAEVAALLTDNFEDIEIIKDYSQNDRIITAKKRAKTDLKGDEV